MSFMASTMLSFSPRQLFGGGEVGVWYDPADLSTMFQDTAGTSPVTAVEQSVALILDKSKGLVLGSELVSNGTFTTNTTGWTANTGTMSVVSSELYVNNNADFCRIVQSITTVIGKTYQLSGTTRYVRGGGTFLRATNDSAGGVTGVLANTSTTTSTTNVSLQCIFTATATTTYIALIASQTGNVSEGYFDNVSVKELPGNHATQSNTSYQPKLSARVNLLTKTEQFDDAYWVKTGLNAFGSGSVVNTTATTDPAGGNTAEFIQENTSNSDHYVGVQNGNTVTSGLSYTQVIHVKPNGRTWVALNAYDTADRRVFFNCTGAGSVGTVDTGVTAYSVTALSNGWYRLSATRSATATTIYTAVNMASADNVTVYTGNGTSGIYIWGADLRVANDGVGLPAYQRVDTATSYATAGFPYYLAFDGSNDCLATSNIDFTGTALMTVWAGVRKSVDTPAYGMVVELSALASGANPGSFNLTAPGSTTSTYFTGCTGSTAAGASSYDLTTYTAPISNVIAVSFNVNTASRANQIIPRVNGATPTLSGGASATQTGAFGTYPLYVGARNNGASLPFSGRLYGLVVRGASSTTGQIADTERWLNGRAMAY